MDNFFGLVLVPIIAIFLLIGWVFNLVGFFGCDFDAPLKCEAVHGIGIPVFIVGGIAGYMDLGQ